jgi:outer membrane protein W
VSVGPLAFLTVDQDTFSGATTSDKDKLSWVVPVGGFVRYTLFRDKTFSPYVRVGVRYPFAGGDNLESSNVGPFGMIGVDIWRNQKVGMSVEVGYDASHVSVKYTNGAGSTLSDKVPYSGFTATLSVLF